MTKELTTTTTLDEALQKFGQEYPEEAEHLRQIRAKDIAILGEDESFTLRDKQGEIRAYKSKVTFSIKDGTITKLTDAGGTLYYNSKAMEIWERESGTIILNFPTVVVDGKEQPNPYPYRDKDTGRLTAVYVHALGFRYSSKGILQFRDITTVFDLLGYRDIDLLAKAKKYKHMCQLLPNGIKPGDEGTWASYKLDEAVTIWVDSSHEEALSMYTQIRNREKKAFEFAQTFSRRNVAAHLASLPKPDKEPITIPVICWRPTQGSLTQWGPAVMASYAQIQKQLDNDTFGGKETVDLVKSIDYVNAEPEVMEEFEESEDLAETIELAAKEAQEVLEDKEPEQKPLTSRENPGDPIWKQYDAVPREFIDRAKKETGIARPMTVAAAVKILIKANEIA